MNTLNSKKASAEQSIIDKISSKDIIKYIEDEQTNIFEKSISSVCYISTEYSSMADKYNLNKEIKNLYLLITDKRQKKALNEVE